MDLRTLIHLAHARSLPHMQKLLEHMPSEVARDPVFQDLLQSAFTGAALDGIQQGLELVEDQADLVEVMDYFDHRGDT